MRGAVLPGDSTVAMVEVPVPEPGPGQVLLAIRASSICGSDLRAIYREHLGHGPEAYRGVIAGHEPCGEVVGVGPDCTRLDVGDRVVVYHIVGCGQCDECRAGYEIGCTSERRQAYGWQRDGGHADYLLAEERSCLALPEPLTFTDGALVSCGFGTAYESLLRIGVRGLDTLLVTGLGPVGLAAAMLGRAMGATRVVGTDVAAGRRAFAERLGLVDEAVDPQGLTSGHVRGLSPGGDGFTRAVDCSGNAAARRLAVASAARWGRVALVGEGGEVTLDVSGELIHRQVSVHGSWVTSTGHMADLLRHLVAWGLHPEVVATDRFSLDEVADAYRVADQGSAGKVVVAP